MKFPAPRQRRFRTQSGGKALLVTLAAALAAAPLAAAWGIGHARVDDYFGPHRAEFASNYSGELQLDLGPIGNAYLPSPIAPIGVVITVHGVGGSAESAGSLFSENTLAAYTSLYADPAGAAQGIVERLRERALLEGLQAEAVLLLIFVGFRLRHLWLAGRVARWLTAWRGLAVYATVLVLVVGSALAPDPRPGLRIPVAVADGDARFDQLTVDSVLLADVLDRGIKGIILLADRQQRAVQNYVGAATSSLADQLGTLPAPRQGEMMLLGLSDLHCNIATTELITRLARVTHPALVMSSGDDTVNGTAAERGCVSREAAIPSDGTPFVVATGNHDSDLTETQMARDGMIVLDGGPAETAGVAVLGDDDPEHNIPFSVERTRDRAETEEELGQRMVDVAHARRTDVILVHQPAAASVIMAAPDLPARLVLWGHYHSEAGPTVVSHADGSWTVGMRESTAGGVRQPTFTSFSTPFSPPLINADVYFYFRDTATGLITGVQPVRFRPDARVVIEKRIATGDLDLLPADTRVRLGATPTPSPGAETPR
jgi:predicted phosphodiesterase